MNIVSGWLTRLIVGGLAVVPFRVIYVLSDFLYILLYKIGRYRRKVIRDNLRRSFPEKSEEEIQDLIRDSYRNLCDVTLETLKGLSLPEEEIRRRFVLKNLEVLKPHFQRGQSILMMGSHLTNWEWGSLAIAPELDVPVNGTYKPLRNPAADTFLNEKRSRFGLKLVPMPKTARVVAANRNTPSMFCLIADQTPSNREKAHWVNFLHQETPFLRGTDQLARATGYPVYYYDTRRVGRGYYEVTFSPLKVNPRGLPEGAVTLAFVRKLESVIREEPADWLWSHRRWKHQPPPGTALLEG